MNKRRDARVGILFAMPWIMGFLIFSLYPLLSSLYTSFTSYSVLQPPKWIGVENYRELLSDEIFIKSVVNTAWYTIAAVPLSTVVAIGLAMLLNTKVKGMAVYRTMFFLPSLVPMVALGTLFLWVFNGDHGLLNAILKPLGLPTPNWLGEPLYAKSTLILISMWGCGQAMIIYLAGLQDVPISLYEAADLDGAKFWAKTRNVTIPMISPVILFNVVMGIIGSMQIFAVPYVMFSGGSPARANYYFSMYLFDNAFAYQRMGFASAMAWIMFAIILVLTLISLRISERHVHYEGG